MATEDGDQAQQSDVPKEGDILAGKYKIDRVLGQGGMGVVVAAHHTTLRQKVAIKFLLPEAAKRGDATERFLREARASVSIQSEHVARVADVGTLDTGAPYMVMEFLTGADLGQVLEERGRLPIDEAVDFVLQACEAIAEAHALGLIHRDLKPANLFLTTRADGSSLVKVLDFGLSKATKADAMDASLTAAHVVMGSPYYMSPEQIRSFKNIDARADIWSMGVILYQLLTGACPFVAESLGALFMMIGSDPVPSMRALRPEIPEDLEAAVVKCLVKDPKARTQTIAELARALAPFGVENSHISVERISRVLSDTTPFVHASSRPPSAVAPVSSLPTAPAVPAAPSLVAKSTTKSGSMSAMAVSAPAPVGLTETARSPAELVVPASGAPPTSSRRGGALVAGAGAVAAVVIAIVAVRGLRGGAGDGAAVRAVAPSTTIAAAPSPPAQAPSSSPAQPAPVASPAAAPQVSATPPSASAVAVTTSSEGAPGLKARSAKGAPQAASSAPKLSKPVSAALKHGETFE